MNKKMQRVLGALFAMSLVAPVMAGNMNMQGKGMNMGGMQMSEEMKDKMARNKQQYILKIDELSDRIHAEKDPARKQKLMNEQLQLIKDHQEKKRQIKMKMMQKHHQKMMQQKQNMKM